jgi:hypothetical protein
MADDKVIERAQKRFNLAADLESEGRIERLDDIKFVRLGQQWPDSVKRDRERPGQERPMLTINRLFQFRNQIINEIRQNRPGIKVRPVDDKSDVDTAEVMQGLIRHIQDASRADIAYDTAAEWQVDCGLGYFRIITDYCEDNSFNQDILIKRVVDPNKVYFDPESTEPDGSDAKWAFVIEDWALDDFKLEFPDVDTTSWKDGVTGDRQGWFGKDFVRVAEYFEIEAKQRALVQLQDGSTIWKDELPEEYQDLVVAERKSFDKKCMWYKIGGDKILDKTELPTSFIPVIPVLGNEVWVEGKRHVHGLTRFAKDPARQYNYMQSANTEVMALAPRAPYIVAEGQIDGYEQEWLMANRHNISVLTYNPVSFGGTTVGAPQRQQGITTNPGFESAMARAVDDMKSSMGIFDASLGNRESQQSGKAILSQQRQASIGNFHFSDNLNRSIRQAGRIIVEMIPKIYDTQRVIRILGEDETPKQVTINPEQPQAKMEQPTEKGGVESIYNFNVGKYDIVVDSGPNYATRRQEAAESMMAFVQADPTVLQVAGDLIVRNLDWPGADEIAKRMQAMLPPQIQQTMKSEEDGKPEVDPQMEQQMQQMADMVEHLSQELQTAQAKVGSDEDKLDIERFKAQTERMKVIAEIETKSSLTDAQLHQLALANLQSTLALGNTGEAEDLDDVNEPQENEQPEQQEAQQPSPEMAQQPPIEGA